MNFLTEKPNKLILRGRLKNIFGEEHVGVFNSPAELMHMMSHRHSAFRSILIEGNYQLIVVEKGVKKSIGPAELGTCFSKVDHVVLLPIAQGHKEGAGKALAGIALVALSFAVPGAVGLAAVFQGAAMGAMQSAFFNIGIGLALTGITSALSPHPKAATSADDSSYLFNGETNTEADGSVEPIALGGPMLTGSLVVSSGVEVGEIGTLSSGTGGGNSGYGGSYGETGLQNGVALDIYQGLKGGKGSGSSASELPNTYQTEAVAKLVEVISSGEIKGFVYPEHPFKNLYFDRTVVQNQDGSMNMQGVQLQARFGLPEQDPFEGFSDVSTTVGVGVKVTYGSGGAVTRQLSYDANGPLDRVIVNIKIPALTQSDASNGSLKGNSVSYKIYIIPNGGSPQVAVTNTISEKFTSPAEKAHSIVLPSSGHPYQVRVERTTPDSVSVSNQNDLYFNTFTEVVDVKLTYPYRAVTAIKAYARQFGSNIPVRGYLIYGVITEVPTNYDPVARTYTGIWDGTFKSAWTNNPVWILWGLLTNKVWGLGNKIPRSLIDRYSFYAPAVYSDVMVDNGKGGTEPRFQYSKWLNSKQETLSFLQAVASTFLGKLIWGKGGIMLTQDRPKLPTRVITKANVVDGVFVYDQVPDETISTVAIVSWINPEDGWRENYEPVENRELLVTKGRIPKDVIADGCFSRRQARDYGRWVLYSEEHNDDTLSYRSGFDMADALPGEVVLVSDSDETSIRYGGRTVAVSSTELTMDAPVAFNMGTTYTLYVTMPDGSIASKVWACQTNQTTNNFPLSSPFSQQPEGNYNSVFVISSSSETPSLWQLLSISEEDDDKLSFTAVKYSDDKFTKIGEAATLEPLVPIDEIFTERPFPVSNISHSRVLSSLSGGNQEKIHLTWIRSPSSLVTKYEVKYRYATGQWLTLTTENLGIDVDYTGLGDYDFEIVAIDSAGRRSDVTAYSCTISGRGRDIATITNLRITGKSSTITTFTEAELRVEWDVAAPSGISNANYEDPYFKQYVIKVYDDSSNLKGTFYTTDRVFRLTEQMSRLLTGGMPLSVIQISVQLQDLDGNLSSSSSKTFSNPAPAAPSGITVAPSVASSSVYVPICTEPDYSETWIWVYASGSWNQNSAPTYRIKGTSIDIPSSSATKMRTAYIDTFSRDNTALNVSAEIDLTVLLTPSQIDNSNVTLSSLGAASLTAFNLIQTEVQNARGAAANLLANVNLAATTANWTSISGRPTTLGGLDAIAAANLTTLTSQMSGIGTGSGAVLTALNSKLDVSVATATYATAANLTTLTSQVGGAFATVSTTTPTPKTWTTTTGLSQAAATDFPQSYIDNGVVAAGVEFGLKAMFPLNTSRVYEIEAVVEIMAGNGQVGINLNTFTQAEAPTAGQLWSVAGDLVAKGAGVYTIRGRYAATLSFGAWSNSGNTYTWSGNYSWANPSTAVKGRASIWCGSGDASFKTKPISLKITDVTDIAGAEANITSLAATEATHYSALSTLTTNLTAKTSQGGLENANAGFDNFANATGLPSSGWSDWYWGAIRGQRVSDGAGGYSFRTTTQVGDNYSGIVASTLSSARYSADIILRVKITKNSGKLLYTYLWANLYDDAGNPQGATYIDIRNATDANGVSIGAGVDGKTYVLEKIVKLGTNQSKLQIFCMNSYNGSVVADEITDITWHEAGWRYATDAEIQANKALNDPLGTGTTLSAAITNEQIARANGDNALTAITTTLQTSVGDYLTKNAKFSAWTTPTSPPDLWFNWNSYGTFTKVAGKFSSSNALKVDIPVATGGASPRTFSSYSNSPWVNAGTTITVDVSVEANSAVDWRNWFVYLQMSDVTMNAVVGDSYYRYWYLFENADASGVTYTTDASGAIRHYSFQFTPSVSGYVVLFFGGGWSYNVTTAQSVTFHKVGARTTSYAEGRVSVLSSALTTLDGRISSLYGIELIAGTSKARFRGLAAGGTNPTSSWLLEADTIMLGGDVKVYTGPGATVAHRVASQPNEYTGSHGQTISYGGTYGGNIPKVELISSINLPALSAGSAYDIRALSITDTQFTVRAVTVTQGGNTLRTSPAASAVGSTTPAYSTSDPRWQTTKPQDGSTALDAVDNNYSFLVSGEAYVSESFPIGGGTYDVTWEASFGIYYKPVGGSWTLVFVATFTQNAEVPASQVVPITFNTTVNASFNPVGNTTSSYCFGVHPVTNTSEVSGFSAKYNTASQSNEQALTGNFTFKVTAPTY